MVRIYCIFTSACVSFQGSWLRSPTRFFTGPWLLSHQTILSFVLMATGVQQLLLIVRSLLSLECSHVCSARSG